ncbi:MAG: hypothetical protein EA397_16775 [Deltaproteobacteria bacterium]|nr:MAG: hypothetical protein EA397_16775 [Deltaproteobacteria bacterium]
MMPLLLFLLAFAQEPPVETSEDPMEAFQAGRALTARRLALAQLEQDPDNIQAHLVVAMVSWNEDGRHAQALARLQLAHRLYQAQKESLGPEAWRTEWHILRLLMFLSAEMGRNNQALDYAERYNQRYNPKLDTELAWIMMSMGRLDEAKELATKGLQRDNYDHRMYALNTLCALSAKQPDRLESLRICEEYVEASGGLEKGEITALRNTALAARGALRYERSEELLLAAARKGPEGWTNPWIDLVVFRLDEGRGAEAAQAALTGQRWRMRESGSTRAQTRAKDDAIFATLFLVAGEPERARTLIDRSLALPDRSSSSTATDDSTRGGHALIRIQVRRAERQRRLEHAAEQGWLPATWAFLQGFVPEWTDWLDHAKVRAALLDGTLLRGSLYENDDDGLVMLRTWMVGEFADIIGPGIVRAGLQENRSKANPQQLVQIIDAHLAELDCRWASKASAQTLLDRAREIPSQEVLLSARLHAIAADCAWRAGDRASALAAYETALQLDPGVLRRLALQLPVSVQHDGGAVARTAAFRLRASPRFRLSPHTFLVTFTDVRACLLAPNGTRIGCYTPPPPDPEAPAPTDDERAAALLGALHQGAFAMPLGLSGHDLRSLDGTTMPDRERSRQRMDQLLDAL